MNLSVNDDVIEIDKHQFLEYNICIEQLERSRDKKEKLMKVFRKTVMIVLVVVMFISAIPVQASVKTAKTAYEKALKGEASAKAVKEKAQKAYDKASVNFRKGSFGFYQWIIDQNTGKAGKEWMVTDAKLALRILQQGEYKSYTKQGNENDATDLDNVMEAVKLFPTFEKVRREDNHFKNLPPIYISCAYMARAQVNANASSYTYNHMMNDNVVHEANSAECLAWGYVDPFNGWYYEEKQIYDKRSDYVLKTYGLDYTSEAWDKYCYEHDTDGSIENAIAEKFPGEVGHYVNVCSGRVSVFYGDGISVHMANKVFAGLAFSRYGYCHCLQTDSFDTYTDGYTVAEFTNLFKQYYNSVACTAEKNAKKTADSAYSKAQTTTKTKLKALKKTLKVTQKTIARKNSKKINLTWKKVKGASGYEISVSPKKGKTKTVSKPKASKTKASVKAKKGKKWYVKTRAYIQVNGKKIYGPWSKVKVIQKNS